jgi:hypothetical protein
MFMRAFFNPFQLLAVSSFGIEHPAMITRDSHMLLFINALPVSGLRDIGSRKGV